MNLALPAVAADYAASARRAFEAAGGVDLARRAEAHPAVRIEVAEQALRDLGAGELPVHDDFEAAVAGAELCREAGAVALPYPVAARLAAADAGFVALVDPATPRIDHGDLPGRWRAVDLRGEPRAVAGVSPPHGATLGPFVVDAHLGGPVAARAGAAELALAFGAATVLGALEAAERLTVAHVKTRVQFGKPLAELQAVRFQVADLTVAVDGLRQLVPFTLWRIVEAEPAATVDALALRVAALESSRAVLRTAHQLHGAIGFCDEHDLSILTRHTQPMLRLPYDLEATTALLVEQVEAHGFSGLYPIAPLRAEATAAP